MRVFSLSACGILVQFVSYLQLEESRSGGSYGDVNTIIGEDEGCVRGCKLSVRHFEGLREEWISIWDVSRSARLLGAAHQRSVCVVFDFVVNAFRE